MFFPAFIAVVAILCIPCLYLLLRNAQAREDARIRALGASDELIRAIPIFQFRKKQRVNDVENGQVLAPMSPMETTSPISIPMQTINPTTSPTTPISNTPTTTPRKKFRFFQLVKRQKVSSAVEPSSSSSITTPHQILELDDEEATCAICLQEYTDISPSSSSSTTATPPPPLDGSNQASLLRQLPCKHHFHVECIDEWLHLNGSCPSCRSDLKTSVSVGVVSQ